jgi:hypothetical protein
MDDELEDVGQPPKKRRVVGNAFDSVKRLVAGVVDPVSPKKDGARPFSDPHSPVNRAEVVIKVRRQKSVISIGDEAGSLASVAMGPPPSIVPSTSSRVSPVPSTFSLQTSGPRRRDRHAEYELSRLRHDLNASQEELNVVRQAFSTYRGETDDYIKELRRELDGPSGDEGRASKGKGKGRAD